MSIIPAHDYEAISISVDSVPPLKEVFMRQGHQSW